MNCSPEDATPPIAIVGMAGRFPGEATDPDKLWKLCAQGRDAWSPIPSTRFNAEAFYHPEGGRNGFTNVRGGFFLKEDLALFDAPFFGMTKSEAAALDPQQRLLLECCYEALEDAGSRMDQVSGTNVGVFVGSFCKDWGEIITRDPDAIPMYSTTGSGQAMLSNRLSYFFNLNGPSFTIDTACSASLVALHLACQSLKARECTSALVAGVNCLLNPDMFISMSSMRFLSPDGRSHTFDQRANGYARGEGVACLFLKPLEEALRSGDPIRAIIRNTGINQDGKTPGITYPSGNAQSSLIRQVYQQAGLDASDTTYVELHGTGTQAGDPVEALAIHEALFRSPSNPPLLVGSVKTNVGHLEGASGLTGLVKTVMMLERQTILPVAGFEMPNKRIPLKEWNMEVPTKCSAWKRSNGLLRASINSFGYGGTNAHIIVEDAWGYFTTRGVKIQAPVRAGAGPGDVLASIDKFSLGDRASSAGNDLEETVSISLGGSGTSSAESVADTEEPTLRLYVLSAYGEESGKQYLDHFQNYLTDYVFLDEGRLMYGLAETLANHRTVFAWKTAVTAGSRVELFSRLRTAKYHHSPKQPRLGFVFTGQGAQWHAMGRELLDLPGFRKSLDESNHCLETLGADWSVMDELCRDAETTRVNEAALSQPLCTIVQIALVDVLRSWGISADAVVGHSSGEIAAAYAAGALQRHDAVAVAYHRGLAVSKKQSFCRGSMVAVSCSAESDVLDILSKLETGAANIACYNSPSSFTVSGGDAVIDEVVEACSTRGLQVTRLRVSVAYHSSKMEAVAGSYRDALSSLAPISEPMCDVFSSVSGERQDVQQLTAEYWVQNLASPVRFSEALSRMCADAKKTLRATAAKTRPISILVEVGPHSALAAPIRQTLQAHKTLSGISYVPTLVRNKDAVSTMLQLAAKLFEAGYPIDVSATNRRLSKPDAMPVRLTGLPSYAWNHSTAYWAEPRDQMLYRLKRWPRHDLLGAQVRFPNPLEPRWRNWIRVSELPWLRDHRVQSLLVYPATGYLCMAIEAARQRAAEANLDVAGFTLREISFSQALVIPEPSGEIQTMLCMRPHQESLRSSLAAWDEFAVYSLSKDGTWLEHCRGLVRVQQRKTLNNVNGVSQAEADLAEHSRRRTEADAAATSIAQGPELYHRVAAIGLDYGPNFAQLRRVRYGNTRAVATVAVPDIHACMPANYHSPFAIHPATLDACLHASFAMRPGLRTAGVPTFISHMSVSDSVSKTPGDELTVVARVDSNGKRDLIDSFDIYDPLDGTLPKIQIGGFRITSLGAPAPTRFTRKTYYQVRLRPDASLLSSADLKALCRHLRPSPGERELLRQMDEVAYYMADKAVAQVPESALPTLTTKNQKLYKSVRRLCDDIEKYQHQMPYGVGTWVTKPAAERDAVWEAVRRSGDEGHFVTLVGDNLTDIIRGNVDPLAATLKDDALGRYYAHNPRMARQYQQAAVFVDLLAHKNPHLRVLEIGAGTGGATIPILTALGGGGAGDAPPRFSSYQVTDITSGFFEGVKAKTVEWAAAGLVSFRKLDIEQDPVTQGFEPETYDLVIAANVLHATRNMRRTMANVRRLVKPGGSLVLIELMPRTIGAANLWGIFDGWWIAEEEERQESPLLAEESWDALLRQTGFSGVDLAVPDTPDEATHIGTTMVSRACCPGTTRCGEDALSPLDDDDNNNDEPLLLVEEEEEGSSIYTGMTAGELSMRKLGGKTPQVAPLEEAMQLEGRRCVVLELDSSILSTMTERRLEALKKIFSRNRGVLWVTRGALQNSDNPELNLVSGLLRTLRAESAGTLAHLDLDATSYSAATAVDVINRVYEHCFFQGIGADADLEFVERAGVLMIPRYVEDETTGAFVASRTNTLEPETARIVQPGRALKLEIGRPGLLDTLYFDDDLRVTEALGQDEVEIEVKATALNFRDVMMAMGQIETRALGCECSGVVCRIGSSVRSLTVGDRVTTFADGTFSTFARTAEPLVHKMPNGMDFAAAATLPIVYGTALRALDVAHVSRSDTVLIHAASGGLGQALIMLCQHAGARILATVGTAEKKDFLVTQYKIPESQIFYSRDDSFARDVMRATAGKGADVIFNSVSSDLLRITWQCIAPFGRFVELGKRDFAINSRLEMAPFAPNVTFAAVDLVHLLEQQPEFGNTAWARLLDLLNSGSIQVPQPISIYGMSETEKALRTMQGGRHLGKLVLVPREEETFRVMPKKAAPTVFRGDASYLLVGGFGGIGRALALKLVEAGAKHILFLSRSGAASPGAASTLELLRERRAVVSVFQCDVADTTAVSQALGQVSLRGHPPIRGVFHLGLVIRNALFEKITLADWDGSLAPKVRGTWNLHRLLPRDLDFFVLVSSMVGVFGNPSQAAYAAASTFQDAFANYRLARGLPAITVDLGMVTGVGYVAERGRVETRLRAQGFEEIPEAECLALLEAAVACPFRAPAVGNIMTGMGLGRFSGGDVHGAAFRDPRFSHARRLALMADARREGTEGARNATSVRVREAFARASSFSEAQNVVLLAVKEKLAGLLMINADDINAAATMSDYGLDSLIAVEMRNWILGEMETNVAILELLGSQTILELCATIARQSKLLRKDLPQV